MGEVLKTLLLPPLIALLIYALLSLLIIPTYRRFRERASYTPVPNSNTSTSAALFNPPPYSPHLTSSSEPASSTPAILLSRASLGLSYTVDTLSDLLLRVSRSRAVGSIGSSRLALALHSAGDSNAGRGWLRLTRRRETSAGGLEGLFGVGDEELEEGVLEPGNRNDNNNNNNNNRRRGGDDDDRVMGERRLSRDLEGGFLSDSDDDTRS